MKLSVKALMQLLIVGAVAGCSTPEPPAPGPIHSGPVDFGVNVIGRPAQLPEGVATYCWEEPITRREANGPGLNAESTWYRPSYIAVRKIRQGKWRPCEPAKREVFGELGDER